jgi:D-arabinose 1-dehydrogenase-like Zn-dependent alcohol dehydrogenase
VKAVVIERPGEAAFREVEAPVMGPDDVLVRSLRAGVCRTDLELFAGELDPRWVRYPCIPGHEWSGVVEEVGVNVTEFASGERVVCEGIIPCDRCSRCRAGETNICENYDQLGFTRGGGYGELVLAPRHVVHRLPEQVSFDAAVLIEPGSVVLRGFERARLSMGESVGVVGTGTLGSLALLLAQLHAPRRLVAFGIRDEELDLARRLGAIVLEHAA